MQIGSIKIGFSGETSEQGLEVWGGVCQTKKESNHSKKRPGGLWCAFKDIGLRKHGGSGKLQEDIYTMETAIIPNDIITSREM